MPRIPDFMLDCSVYLYPSKLKAEAGEQVGGSGFLIYIPYKKKINDVQHSHVYAISNSHVVRKNPTIRVNTLDNKLDSVEIHLLQWIHHPNADVAACPIKPSEHHKLRYVSVETLLTRDLIQEYDIGVGSDVVSIGRFINHEGKEQNLPVVRFGNISMMPLEPVYNSTLSRQEESYLVEARSISGYSGSVVWVSNRAFDNPDRRGGILGIAWGHLTKKEYARDQIGNEIRDGDGNRIWHIADNAGMMTVVPSWKILELLNAEEFVMMREEIENRAYQETEEPLGGAIADSAEEVAAMTKEKLDEIMHRVSLAHQPLSDNES